MVFECAESDKADSKGGRDFFRSGSLHWQDSSGAKNISIAYSSSSRTHGYVYRSMESGGSAEIHTEGLNVGQKTVGRSQSRIRRLRYSNKEE
jgi:hypothetical protein